MTRKRSKGSIKSLITPAAPVAPAASGAYAETPSPSTPPPTETTVKDTETTVKSEESTSSRIDQSRWYTRTWPRGQKAEPVTQVTAPLKPIPTEQIPAEVRGRSTASTRRTVRSPMDKLVPPATTTTGVSKVELRDDLTTSEAVEPAILEPVHETETTAVEPPPVSAAPDVNSAYWFSWWASQPTPEIKEPKIKVEPPAEDPVPEPTPESTPAPEQSTTVPTQPARSWLSVWPLASEPPKPVIAKQAEEAAPQTSVTEQPPQPETIQTDNMRPAKTDAPKPTKADEAKPTKIDDVKASDTASINLANRTSWAFWSSSSAVNSTAALDTEGELAIADTPSQSQPQKAKATEPVKEDPSVTQTEMPGEGAVAKPKHPSQAKQQLERIVPPNLLVPSFESCYMAPPSQGLLDHITKYFKAVKPSKHHSLHLLSQPPKIKKAIAIGVHGFFPMKLVQKVLGEPTGTSLRFATAGAAAIQRWADAHGQHVEIQKVSLEGEGKVADRVVTLWKLLRNWLTAIQEADYVLFCCHSQGTPVGIQLVAKLIEHGHVDNAKIGIVGMAGINLGPFAELNSRLFSGSAKELFDFSNANSAVSKKYIESIRTVISHGVKIVLVASVDDQLVPLESATFSNITHPFIFRAVFVDGRVHAPDFISHLVGFALKLRNIGVSDHGVIRELSAPLAGSLYSGAGHSRIYDDVAIYDLAVRHSLETTTSEFLNTPLRVEEFELAGESNPFYLPWSMRGLLEEKHVRDELEEEAKELLAQFDRWKPVSKQLKDVKFRLEAIKSKL